MELIMTIGTIIAVLSTILNIYILVIEFINTKKEKEYWKKQKEIWQRTDYHNNGNIELVKSKEWLKFSDNSVKIEEISNFVLKDFSNGISLIL